MHRFVKQANAHLERNMRTEQMIHLIDMIIWEQQEQFGFWSAQGNVCHILAHFIVVRSKCSRELVAFGPETEIG